MTKNLDFDIFKYQHVERFGTDETEYLLDEPRLVVQPKIDGTNALVVYNPETKDVIPGSRNRFLTVQNDNEGFARLIQENYGNFLKALEEIFEAFKSFTPFNPDYIVLCGEMTKNGTFLVDPKFLHKFFVFDVVAIMGNEKYYIQIATLRDDENILEIVNKYGKKYPITIVPTAKEGSTDAANFAATLGTGFSAQNATITTAEDYLFVKNVKANFSTTHRTYCFVLGTFNDSG